MTQFVDFNILNRASFSNKPLSVDLRVGPTLYEGTSSHTLGNSIFWVQHISWKAGYWDVGMYMGNNTPDTPLKPLKVTVSGGTEKPILDQAEEEMGVFMPPIPIASRIDFAVQNTNIGNNHELRVKFLLKGVLVTPKPGQDPLTLKQMLGYIQMDESKKGELAFAEAVVDSLDEKMIGMGMESIRTSLPHGLGAHQLAIRALPEPLQRVLLQNMAGTLGLPGGPMDAAGQPLALTMGQQPGLMLPEVDPEREKSTFLGDLLGACEDLSTDQMRKISEKMVEKGWRRV